MRRTRFVVLAVAVARLARAGDDAAWTNVRHLERGTSYTFIVRDGTCATGRIQDVKPDTLFVGKYDYQLKTVTSILKIPRSQVLQINDSGLLYSARSSWLDVNGIEPHHREFLTVMLKSGKTIHGDPAGAIVDKIFIKRGIVVEPFAKADVARVSYVRLKPISDTLSFIAREGAGIEILIPAVWPYLLNIGVHLTVPVYDALKPEDNSKLQCLSHR